MPGLRQTELAHGYQQERVESQSRRRRRDRAEHERRAAECERRRGADEDGQAAEPHH